MLFFGVFFFIKFFELYNYKSNKYSMVSLLFIKFFIVLVFSKNCFWVFDVLGIL